MNIHFISASLKPSTDGMYEAYRGTSTVCPVRKEVRRTFFKYKYANICTFKVYQEAEEHMATSGADLLLKMLVAWQFF